MDEPGASLDSSALGLLKANRDLMTGNMLKPHREVLSSGLSVVDRFLPFGGFQRGGISELIGSGFKHLLAICALARASQEGNAVASLSPEGVMNPHLLVHAGADLKSCHFLVEGVSEHLFWSAEQVVGSGLFSLVVLYASCRRTGILRLSSSGYRRILWQAKKHRCVVLMLLESHAYLPYVGRPCALRLRVERQGDGLSGRVTLCVVKCSGAAPGAYGTFSVTDLCGAEE